MSEKYIKPLCMKDEGHHYVCAEGHWAPCCALPQKYREYFANEDFNVLTQTDFHLKDKFLIWADHNLSNYETAPSTCKKRCGVANTNEEKFYRSGDEAIVFYRENSSS